MFSISNRHAARLLTTILPLIVLAGCFGKGQGPDRIQGNPPPPPDCSAKFNFEDGCGPYSFVNFESGFSQIVDNPDPTD